MNRSSLIVQLSAGVVLAICAGAAAQDPLLDAMQQELERSVSNLSDAGAAPLYHLQYALTDKFQLRMEVVEGGLEAPDRSRERFLDVDLRVGSSELDNTHEIRGGGWRDNYTPRRVIRVPLDDSPDALRAALWLETEYQLSQAQERLTKVLANRQVKVEEEDLSIDFSASPPQRYEEEFTHQEVDSARWSELLKRMGTYFRAQASVQKSTVALNLTEDVTRMVSSEGSRLKHGQRYVTLRMEVSGMADDGMELERSEYYSAANIDDLPAEAIVMQDAERLVRELEGLLTAPVVDPYIGPAILVNRASGVFFHEIFGHRIEGHRQKSESEGQTFTRKVGQQILPEFISIYDDPTLDRYKGMELRGHYKFDDEGVAAERVTVVEHGVLKNFLTSRSPIENFPVSNGHGRREYGNQVVSRQGNLIVQSDTSVSYVVLRGMLIEECIRQGKPYGLVFDDISGGFTMTRRAGPQAFKVKPLLVYRVYSDGGPDEMVRGVDIVGTPLTSFSKILMAGDDDAAFNGTCGAESGMVPVAAVSPSILVSEIEVEKSRKGQDKPPILPAPEN